MNFGQLLGEQKLRIWQLEDELESTRTVGMPRSTATTLIPIPEFLRERPRSRHESEFMGTRRGLRRRVVEFLEASPMPLGCLQIAQALNCSAVQVYHCIPMLVRAGRVTRHGRRRHYEYWAAGKAAA